MKWKANQSIRGLGQRGAMGSCIKGPGGKIKLHPTAKKMALNCSLGQTALEKCSRYFSIFCLNPNVHAPFQKPSIKMCSLSCNLIN